MSERRSWTDSELVLALDLYCRTRFGRLHSKNPEIVELAGAIGRTPSAVAMKCVNFASLDPAHQARGVSGLKNASQRDAAVYQELTHDLAALSEASRSAAARVGVRWSADVEATDVPADPSTDGVDGDAAGWMTMQTESTAARKFRLNQRYFRTIVLSAYQSACAVCGLAVSPLLDAAHIIPWSDEGNHRLDPRNGIAMCALHHRAFDAALLMIDVDGRFRLSRRLFIDDPPPIHAVALIQVDGVAFAQPERFAPAPESLEHHRQRFLSKAS